MKSQGAFSWIAVSAATLALSGCTVISVTTSAVGLAADAAIGTVKIVGKGVGKAADALLDDDTKKDDGSGITIKYREPTPVKGGAASSTSSPPPPAAINSPQ